MDDEYERPILTFMTPDEYMDYADREARRLVGLPFRYAIKRMVAGDYVGTLAETRLQVIRSIHPDFKRKPSDISSCLEVCQEHHTDNSEFDGEDYSLRVVTAPEPDRGNDRVFTEPGQYYQEWELVPIKTCFAPHPYPALVASTFTHD